jgi:hypothetical protein
MMLSQNSFRGDDGYAMPVMVAQHPATSSQDMYGHVDIGDMRFR